MPATELQGERMKKANRAAQAPAVEEFETLNHAARLLGISRAMVKKAIAAGLIRASEAPFKSNLNPGGSTSLVLVNLADIRSVLTGAIDLAAIRDVRNVAKKELPGDLSEFAERFVNLEQSVEQACILLSAIHELMSLAPKPKKKETPDG